MVSYTLPNDQPIPPTVAMEAPPDSPSTTAIHALPVGVLQYTLNMLSNPKDLCLAGAACTSWRHLALYDSQAQVREWERGGCPTFSPVFPNHLVRLVEGVLFQVLVAHNVWRAEARSPSVVG